MLTNLPYKLTTSFEPFTQTYVACWGELGIAVFEQRRSFCITIGHDAADFELQLNWLFKYAGERRR